MKERENIIKFGGVPMTLLGEELKVGQKAPDFVALNSNLEEVRLSDFAGKVVAIASFPSIDTGICSLQAARFNEEAAKFGDAVQILTISCDLPFALGRHCAANGIENALTLSDHRDLSFGLEYGFAIKELRLLARGSVVIDKEGNVAYVEYVPEIKSHPNYDAALEVIKNNI